MKSIFKKNIFKTDNKQVIDNNEMTTYSMTFVDNAITNHCKILAEYAATQNRFQTNDITDFINDKLERRQFLKNMRAQFFDTVTMSHIEKNDGFDQDKTVSAFTSLKTFNWGPRPIRPVSAYNGSEIQNNNSPYDGIYHEGQNLQFPYIEDGELTVFVSFASRNIGRATTYTFCEKKGAVVCDNKVYTSFNKVYEITLGNGSGQALEVDPLKNINKGSPGFIMRIENGHFHYKLSAIFQGFVQGAGALIASARTKDGKIIKPRDNFYDPSLFEREVMNIGYRKVMARYSEGDTQFAYLESGIPEIVSNDNGTMMNASDKIPSFSNEEEQNGWCRYAGDATEVGKDELVQFPYWVQNHPVVDNTVYDCIFEPTEVGYELIEVKERKNGVVPNIEIAQVNRRKNSITDDPYASRKGNLKKKLIKTIGHQITTILLNDLQEAAIRGIPVVNKDGYIAGMLFATKGKLTNEWELRKFPTIGDYADDVECIRSIEVECIKLDIVSNDHFKKIMDRNCVQHPSSYAWFGSCYELETYDVDDMRQHHPTMYPYGVWEREKNRVDIYIPSENKRTYLCTLTMRSKFWKHVGFEIHRMFSKIEYSVYKDGIVDSRFLRNEVEYQGEWQLEQGRHAPTFCKELQIDLAK